MAAEWNLADLLGSLGTWSATQRYIWATKLMLSSEEQTPKLRSAWQDPQQYSPHCLAAYLASRYRVPTGH